MFDGLKQARKNSRMQGDYSLYDRISKHGIWWNPESPDECIRGDIKYDGDRLRLKLYGAFAGTDSIHINRELPRILGRCGNEDVTLLNCHLGSRQNIQSASITTEWRPRFAIIGLHVTSGGGALFDEAQVRFTGLEDWIGDRPFTDSTRHEHSDPLVTFKVEHRHAEPRDFDVQSLDAQIGLTANCTQHGSGYEIDLEHRSYVRITPADPKSLDWFIGVQHQFQRMLCFFADSSVQTLSVRLFQQGETEFDRPNGCVLWSAIQGKNNSDRLRRGMLISYPDIASRFSEVLDIWFRNGERLRHVYDLFFAATQRETIYLDQDFLQLAQAIEVFSRVARGGKYLPEDEYQQVADQLVDAIPENTESSLRQSLKSRIRFGNEFSLRKRIAELLRGLDEETTRLLTTSPKDFVARVVDTRNYLVHLDDASRGNPFTEEELFQAMQRLRALLMMLLMLELKFTESDVRRIVGRSSLLRNGAI
ncbi:HEPN domain-containing protein [Planctomycetaceae bacterium SH139]